MNNIEKITRKERLLYAAQEFGKAILGSKSERNKVPQEEKVSIDLGYKLIFDRIYNRLLTITSKEYLVYINEVGTQEKKSYKALLGYETIAKRFSPQEEQENTKIIKLDDKNDYKLFNQDGSLFDTKEKFNKNKEGCVSYAISLNGNLVTYDHIKPNIDVEYGYYHSTLLAGRPGLCFGMLKATDGIITDIDTFSGHYKPTQENLYNALFERSELHRVLSKKLTIGTNYPILLYNKFKYLQIKENIDTFKARIERKGENGLNACQQYFHNLKLFNTTYKAMLENPLNNQANHTLSNKIAIVQCGKSNNSMYYK